MSQDKVGCISVVRSCRNWGENKRCFVLKVLASELKSGKNMSIVVLLRLGNEFSVRSDSFPSFGRGGSSEHEKREFPSPQVGGDPGFKKGDKLQVPPPRVSGGKGMPRVGERKGKKRAKCL